MDCYYMIWLWLGFIFLITILLALDFGVLNRKSHEIKSIEAFIRTAFWILQALLFNLLVYYICENHFIFFANSKSINFISFFKSFIRSNIKIAY